MEKPFSAYRGNGPYVFVCYAHEDSKAVYREIAWLNDYGVNVWFDEGISPGREWTEELASAIQGCTKVLYFVSPDSVKSEHCRRELNFAQEEGREIVAIQLVPTDVPAGLRLSLNNRQAILKHELPDEEYRKRLMRVTHEGISPTPTSGTLPRSRPGRRVLVFTLSIIALAIVAAGVWWYRTHDRPRTDAEESVVAEPEGATSAEVLHNSIAVLPFANLSPDPDNAYFAAGIHEEILNQLARIRDMSVIARTTMMRYAQSSLSVPEIGEELSVETVMEGSVRYAGDRVRITVQLIDAQSGAHLWSEAYEESLEDIFGVQLAIATQIANTLKAEFSSGEQARIARRGTSNTQAHGYYIRALAGLRNLASTEPIHHALDTAIALDSEFADALAFKALIYGYEAGFGQLYVGDSFSATDQNRLIALTEEYALRALELDGEQARAYSALRQVALYNRDWGVVNVSTDRAYALSPNDSTVLADAAWNAANLGDTETAIRLHERAIELNPADAGTVWNFSELLYSTQQWAAARDQAGLFTEMMPDSPLGYALLARVGAHLEDPEAVRRYAAMTEVRNPSVADLASLAVAYAGIDDLDEAKRLFRIAGGGDDSRIPDFSVHFSLHLAVGDYDTALDYLERAIGENFPFMFCVGVHFRPDHPDAQPLQALARYDELVRRLANPLDLPR